MICITITLVLEPPAFAVIVLVSVPNVPCVVIFDDGILDAYVP